MNVTPENIVGSCEYTPVYLIQSPVVTLPESYLVASAPNQDKQKPLSDNLKKFYESSGNLENALFQPPENIPKPRILKKHPIPANGYKLSSFLKLNPSKVVHKISNLQDKECKPKIVNSAVTKAAVTNHPNLVNGTSILMDRKIVKLSSIPKDIKHVSRPLPKSKPKESSVISNNTLPHTQSKPKLTSVQLLKLGETYHSLSHLSDGQMKIVNQALKIFSNPEKASLEPTYDPVTNTRFIYKVVSPKDLTVVGKNKIVIKKRAERKYIPKTIEKVDSDVIDRKEEMSLLQKKVTRSNRIVKLQAQLEQKRQENAMPKNDTHDNEKDAEIDCCKQCCEEVKGLYSLKKHEERPNKVQSSLFNYLLAIVKNAPERDKATIFIQQLEQLVDKLKLLLPCLLKETNGCEGKQCSINEDIGRLFNIIPGNYNLNIEAMHCEKDKEGNCPHNPKKYSNPIKKPVCVDDEVNKLRSEQLTGDDTDVCARIKPVGQWPTVKRVWTAKPTSKVLKVITKKIRLVSENTDLPIELGTEDQNSICKAPEPTVEKALDVTVPALDSKEKPLQNQPDKPPSQDKITTHHQFSSAHFDIRSSPIKPSTNLFTKFQINPDKLPKNDVQVLNPLEQTEKEELPQELAENILQEMFKHDILSMNKEVNDVCQVLSFEDAKNWPISNGETPILNDCTDSLLESALMHVTGETTQTEKMPDTNELTVNDLSNQGHSMLNFLESLGNECLAYPETEIRNNAIDFQLDLFSFQNT